MRKIITAVCALPLSLLASQASAETISCVLENNKVVTVSHLSSEPVYSYGTADKVELTLPTKSASSRVYKGAETFMGGGSTYIAFTNGAYTYALYNGIGRGWEFVGLRVYKGVDIILEKSCKDYDSLPLLSSAINAPEDDLPY